MNAVEPLGYFSKRIALARRFPLDLKLTGNAPLAVVSAGLETRSYQHLPRLKINHAAEWRRAGETPVARIAVTAHRGRRPVAVAGLRR